MITGLETPQGERRNIMKFPKPSTYEIRVITYLKYFSTWIPSLSVDADTGGFKTVDRAFNIKADDNLNHNLLYRIGSIEKAVRKEAFEEKDSRSYSCVFLPRQRYRLIGFDLSGSEYSDPNTLAVFDFGVKLEEQLKALAWGSNKKDPRYLDYGPLWGYNVYLTRKGDTKNTTSWTVQPVEKLGPFDKLPVDIRDPKKYAEWVKTVDLSKFFTPEQLAVVEGQNLHELIHSGLNYVDNEKIVSRFNEEPVNLGHTKDGEPSFPPQIVNKLWDKLQLEAKRLSSSGQLFLLNEPAQTVDVAENDDMMDVTTPDVDDDAVVVSGEDDTVASTDLEDDWKF